MTTGRPARRRWRGALVVVAALMVASGTVFTDLAAHAQQGSLDMDLQSVEVREDGETVVTLDLRGTDRDAVDGSTFQVVEDGEAIDQVSATSTFDAPNPEPRFVILAMDTSNSTAGAPRQRSIAAAKNFANQVVPQGVSVGVVAFARNATLEEEPTDELEAISTALDNLPAGNATALYDGIVVSSQALSNFDGRRTIVVFSDGADSRSEATLDLANEAATTVGATVTSVALSTDDLDVDALESLARATDGRVLEVDGVDGLGGAFQEVAEGLNSQFRLTYPSTGRTGTFDVEVTAAAEGSITTRSMTVLNTFKQPTVEPPNVVAVQTPALGANPVIPVVAIAGAAVALAMLAWALFVPLGDRQVAKNLQATIGTVDPSAPGTDVGLSPATAAMSRRAIELVERVPRPQGYDATLQTRIDRAAWPVRASEFTAVRAILAVVGLALGWTLVNVVIGALLAAVAWVLPNIVLGIRVSRHQAAFMEQLPDTLQLLSGSLKAGYGVLQAIDTVVKETQEPTKSEFQRVLSEARLGLALEDSLTDMAGRIGTDDFRWVAVSISIQRRVGGNLAQLLETVAATLRERAGTRRQIRALSAEGRISALVLVLLPFGLGGYLFLSNPDYLRPLWTTSIGQVMSAGAALLMAAGMYWMKNIIEIDV